MTDAELDRLRIYNKYDGLCAYSGSPLDEDWQIDHVFPVRFKHFLKSEVMKSIYKIELVDINQFENLVPCQKIINHYKRGLLIDDPHHTTWNFRHRISVLHIKVGLLPKNPRVQRSITRKEYLLKVAGYFGITSDNPFDGVFYFEKVEDKS